MVWVDSGTWSSAVRFQGVTKITAASSESFDAAVREGLARANKTVRGITGLHVIEHKASVENGKIEEYRVTMEVTFILEN
jgi:flavin-binding protein dodecin